MRRTRMTSWAGVVGLLLALVVPEPASAATVHVDMAFGPSGLVFSPARATLAMGDTALWTNATSFPHTASASGCPRNPAAGPAAFCSPSVSGSATFSTTLNVAATYHYICVIHPSMQGTISVRPTALPPSGTVAQTYTITWAAGSVPPGFNVDIRVQRPGQGFVDWLTNQTTSQVSATFTPDAGPGRYAFRVRLESSTTGAATAYSKPAIITAS